LPDRLSVSAILAPEERKQFLCHVLVKRTSPLVGRRLAETELADKGQGFRIIEVRRGGSRLTLPLNEIEVNAYDRILLAVSAQKMEKTVTGTDTLKTDVAERLGIENLSTIQGAIIEGIVAAHSRLIGKTLKSARFRQAYGMLALGIHRGGKNLAANFQNTELQFGDTVLMLGPTSTFAQFRDEGDFMFLEERAAVRGNRKQAWISVVALAGVVVVAAMDWAPIVFAATAACVVVLWRRCISPQEAYQSIDWTVIFLLFGMLAMGAAMERTGAAAWVAQGLVGGIQLQAWIPPEWLPYVVLALFYLLGSALTEVLSNNATAVVLTPIAINSALSLGMDPRPFIFAVAFSASAAFTTPIGYQTHMLVYGAGGYRFSDFVKFGLPLNIILWLVSSWFIPIFWPFYP
jgi:di/tricarboxylate transporter